MKTKYLFLFVFGNMNTWTEKKGGNEQKAFFILKKVALGRQKSFTQQAKLQISEVDENNNMIKKEW